MNQAAAAPPVAPTEKAQVVIHFLKTEAPIVLRFNSVKDAQKAFDKLKNAKTGSPAIEIDTAVFRACISHEAIVLIALVEHAKNVGFVPWGASG